MSEMKAARLYKAGEPLKIEIVPVPSPSFGEVLIEVAACGLCGTDIHLAVDGDLPVACSPITLGHEAAGTVKTIGEGVSGFTIGERVALFPSATCGHCRFCSKGRESLCENSKVYGMARDGSLAQFVVAPAHTLIKIPDGIPFDVAAVVTDGVATPFHALRSRGRLQAGESVAVVGCGGLGTHAIILARMMGAEFIAAIDVQEEARERALEVGADIAINPMEEDPRKAIRRHTGGSGVDLSLEFVGKNQTAEISLRVLDTTGRAVFVGVGMERPVLPPLVSFVGREHSVLGSFGMDKADIEDLFKLIAGGRLDLSRSITARYPLNGINDALTRLSSKDTGIVRLIVEPGKIEND